MLKPTEDIRNRLTFTYRGYDLEISRALSGWQVGMYPRSADLPILSRNDFVARDEGSAIDQARKRIDWALLS
jgi:hypothetical protein